MALEESKVVMWCVQCMLEAFVKGEECPVSDGTPEEHMRLVHPGGVDPVKRRELEQRAGEIIKERNTPHCRESGNSPPKKIITSGGVNNC